MAKSLNLKARPEGGWSLAVVTSTTQALHERYAAIVGNIDMGTLKLAVRRAGGEMTKQTLELDDGYLPYATADFSAGMSFGDVRVVFPFCTDFPCEDGDMCDRAVTVHALGEVPDSAVDRIAHALTESLPEFPRASENAEGAGGDELLHLALAGDDGAADDASDFDIA